MSECWESGCGILCLTLMHCYTLRHKISKIFKNVRYKETFYNIYKKDLKFKVLMSTLCVLLGCFTSSSPDIIIVWYFHKKLTFYHDYSTEAPIFDKCHIFTIKWSIMKLFFLSLAVWWMKHRIYTAPHLRVSAFVCYILNYIIMSHNMNSPPQPFVNLNIKFTTTGWVTVWWRWRMKMFCNE